LAEALLASDGRSGASGGRTALGGAIDFGQSGGTTSLTVPCELGYPAGVPRAGRSSVVR
jgi:hypothetical protein